MEKVIELLIVDDACRREVHKELCHALIWKGHDLHCQCHACGSIRKIARILEDHGIELEEYT